MKYSFATILLLVASCFLAKAQETLTNQNIIALHESKVSRSLIEEKIGRSQTRFDMSSDGLLGLKIAKVPEPVMDAMLLVTKPTDVMQNSDVISLYKAGLSRKFIIKKIEASPTRFNVETSGIVELKTAKIPEVLIEAMMTGGTPEPVASSPTPKVTMVSAKPTAKPTPAKKPTKSPTQTTPFKDALYANQTSKAAAKSQKTSDGRNVSSPRCDSWFDKFTKKNVTASQVILRGYKIGANLITKVVVGTDPGTFGIEDMEVDLIFRRDGSNLSLVLYARKPGLNTLVVSSEKPLMLLMQDESVMQFMPAENSETDFDWSGGGSFETQLLMYYALTQEQAQTLSRKLIKGYRLNLYNRNFVEDTVNEKRAIQVTMAAQCMLN